MVAILDFQLERFKPFLIYRSSQCFLPSFRANWRLVQGEKQKTDFKDSHHGSHLDLQVTLMLPTKFRVNWPFGSGEEGKNRFSRWPPWWHLGFMIRQILAIFDLQVIPMLPTKFRVNWPFGSGEEAKNSFSRWLPWPPSSISDRNNFSYFWSTGHPDASYQVSNPLAPGYRRSRLLKQLLTQHYGR